LGTGDFQGAWKTLQGIASGPSRSDAVLNTQVDVAMVWLGMLVSMGPHTKEVYDDLTAVFFAALPKAKGNRAADIQAHIGWAYHLMSKEYPHAGVNIDAELRKALDFEPQNPYANAMLGYRLLFPTEKVEEARKHFETALASKREVPWVRSMQLEAFELLDRDAYKLELARIANEMRKNGEPMSDERKRKLFYGVYWSGANYSFLTNLIHSLPSSEHLSTLDWLAGEELWAKSWPEQRFVLAALRERTGDWSGALQFYTNLARLGDPYQEEIKSAIARCKARARAM
jgi:hypothetical protein